MSKKILVIDDDQISLKNAKHILETEYEVYCATSGEEGLDFLKNNKVSLVLLDLMMPNMSGMDVLKTIREDSSMATTRVAILTGSEDKSSSTDAVRQGVLDIIKKPFSAEDLLQRVGKAISSSKKEKILVVDDERINQMLTKKMLGERYDVECISSGAEAISFLEHNTPHLVLLDLHMPNMSGLEVMAEMQTRENMRNIPVIFITADNEQKTELEIFKAGAMDYIQKPFIPEIVMRRISRVLELYRLQNSLQDEVEVKTAELLESNRKVKSLSRQVMVALAETIDAKDKYTNGHSARVAEYSREIGRRMGKTTEEIDSIFYIGLLHDIGKIGVPNEIISKPARLTDKEYDIIKTHPGIGARILDSISEMPDLAIGAHWHHERFDGKGYPDGLAGYDIPEIARIIGVADAYDAMTSNRAYRSYLPQQVVREEIVKCAGTQFDPAIADVMIRMIDEDTEYTMHE